VHINLVVSDPDASARFYIRYVLQGAICKWLGDSLHVRNSSCDLAFRRGTPSTVSGVHHGFLAESSVEIDALAKKLLEDRVGLSENQIQEGFRSIKFFDPDGYQCEVYWEEIWP
jgi:catechol 2,3-dioxygenase-like lactoylglutathione lyase family enzyme